MKKTYEAPHSEPIHLLPSTILCASGGSQPEIKFEGEIPEGDLSDVDNL